MPIQLQVLKSFSSFCTFSFSRIAFVPEDQAGILGQLYPGYYPGEMIVRHGVTPPFSAGTASSYTGSLLWAKTLLTDCVSTDRFLLTFR